MIEMSLTLSEVNALLTLVDHVIDLTCKESNKTVREHLVVLHCKMQQAVDVWTSTDNNRAAV